MNYFSKGRETVFLSSKCICAVWFGISLICISLQGYAVIPINSIDNLQKIGNDVSYPIDGAYELTQDIDASDTVNWNGGKGFAPIGTALKPFTGGFNGKGHVIKNLYINDSNQDNIGLFGYVGPGGWVSDLKLDNANVSGNYFVGSLVGWNSGGNITKCSSSGAVSGVNYLGGLVGVNISYSSGNGNISRSFSTCSLSGADNAGGLIGWNVGTVVQCYALGAVSGASYNIGGFVGLNDGSITECYSAGLVSGMNRVGGFVGYNEYGAVNNSYWDINASGQSNSDEGIGKTTIDMKKQMTFTGWDFINVWDIVENETYPYFGWQYTVPNVVGMERSSAENTIISSGLIVGTATEQCSNSVAVGRVIDQYPEPGEQVLPGSAVNIVVSTGPCLTTVPNVIGSDITTAGNTLAGADLNVGTITYQCNNNVSAGIIIDQNPQAGTQAIQNSSVSILVSTGPCPEGQPEGINEGIPEGTPEGAVETNIVINQQIIGTVSGDYYVPGSNVTVRITCNGTSGGDITSLTLTCYIPAGWQYLGCTNGPQVSPTVGTISDGVTPLEFVWTTIPSIPFTFDINAGVPSTATSSCSIQTILSYILSSGSQFTSNTTTFNFSGASSGGGGGGSGGGGGGGSGGGGSGTGGGSGGAGTGGSTAVPGEGETTTNITNTPRTPNQSATPTGNIQQVLLRDIPGFGAIFIVSAFILDWLNCDSCRDALIRIPNVIKGCAGSKSAEETTTSQNKGKGLLDLALICVALISLSAIKRQERK